MNLIFLLKIVWKQTPILELKYNKKIIVPVIEDEILTDPNFFFILCQNQRSTFWPKDLPEKLKIIIYPPKIKEEIEEICFSIFENYKAKKENLKLTKQEVKLYSYFMMELNKNQILMQLSLWDISKLFIIIFYQSLTQKDYYSGLNLKENILFYILSATNDSLCDINDENDNNNKLKIVLNLICKKFNINDDKENML